MSGQPYLPQDVGARECQKFTNENSIASAERPLATMIDCDGSGNPLYIGKAVIGSLSSAPVWQIKQINYDGAGNVASILWATDTFVNIWDNRTDLTYS